MFQNAARERINLAESYVIPSEVLMRERCCLDP
jgi:hypothetical protein